jgi:AraC family transcriptional regulator
MIPQDIENRIVKESLVRKFAQITLFILGILVLIHAGCGKNAEEEKSYDILTKTADKMTIVYLEHTGPYDRMGDVFARIGEYAAAKELTGDVVGIYFDDPTVVPGEKQRSQIGILVTEGIMPDSDLHILEIPEQKVVYAILRGPYGGIANEYPYIVQWAKKKGYSISGPLMEIYWEAGPDIPPEELVTEVRIPIKEK